MNIAPSAYIGRDRYEEEEPASAPHDVSPIESSYDVSSSSPPPEAPVLVKAPDYMYLKILAVGVLFAAALSAFVAWRWSLEEARENEVMDLSVQYATHVQDDPTDVPNTKDVLTDVPTDVLTDV
jgi:hypothetical protein